MQVRGESDVPGGVLHIADCHEAAIYVLAPLQVRRGLHGAACSCTVQRCGDMSCPMMPDYVPQRPCTVAHTHTVHATYRTDVQHVTCLQYVHVSGCSDCTVVLGAVGRVVRFERCEKVTATLTAARCVVSSCHSCTLHLGVNQGPGESSCQQDLYAY